MRKLLDENDPFLLRTQGNYAIVLKKLKKLEQAEMIEREVSHRSEEVLGKNHPDTVGAKKNLMSTLKK